MEIKIIRGENQIGGNIVEIFTNSTKILLDVGLELDDCKNKDFTKVDGLFDAKGYDAVFISHYHLDHVGLAYSVFKEIPIYIGKQSFNILKASDNYKRIQPISPYGFLKHKTPIILGDINVTPFLCDHSAYDSFMFLVEADNQKILYTGDFRGNGRKKHLIAALPQNIDILICEGTTLSRTACEFEKESSIENNAYELFRNTNGPIFVLQSSTNIDRLVSMYRAAKRTGRIFLEELYLAEIASSIKNIPNPIDFNDVKVFITKSYNKTHFRYTMLQKYGANRISKNVITHSKFVMCIRSSMLEYMESLNKRMSFENGLLVYSLWEGYKQQAEMQQFIQKMSNMGLKVATLHTSGHADEKTILELIKHTSPRKILPIHTENAKWFERV